MAAYTTAELQGQVELLISAVKAAQEREATLRAALAEYANADNWKGPEACVVGRYVARVALEQAPWQAVPV